MRPVARRTVRLALRTADSVTTVAGGEGGQGGRADAAPGQDRAVVVAVPVTAEHEHVAAVGEVHLGDALPAQGADPAAEAVEAARRIGVSAASAVPSTLVRRVASGRDHRAVAGVQFGEVAREQVGAVVRAAVAVGGQLVGDVARRRAAASAGPASSR